MRDTQDERQPVLTNDWHLLSIRGRHTYPEELTAYDEERLSRGLRVKLQCG
jgi:hypothetical protein